MKIIHLIYLNIPCLLAGEDLKPKQVPKNAFIRELFSLIDISVFKIIPSCPYMQNWHTFQHH